MASGSHVFLMVFSLHRLKRAGIRPQPQGLRASKSRKALMLGVKPGGVPLGFKRSKRFLWFLSILICSSINKFLSYDFRKNF